MPRAKKRAPRAKRGGKKAKSARKPRRRAGGKGSAAAKAIGQGAARVASRGGQALRRGLGRLLGQGWAAARGVWHRLGAQHRRDIGGVLLLALAGLLFLAQLLPPETTALGWLRRASEALFGWGTWLTLLALALAGLSLLLAARQGWPTPSAVQGLGLALLLATALLALSAWALHRGLPPQVGGGWLAGWIWWLLLRGFGLWGAWLWWAVGAILGLALILDQPVIALMAAPWQALRRLWGRVRPARRGRPRARRRARPRVVAQTKSSTSPPPRPSAAATPGTAPTSTPAWVLPRPEDVLNPDLPDEAEEAVDYERAAIIEETLAHFGAPVQVVDIQRGPTVTLFGVVPDYIETRGGKVTKVRVNKIVSLADDLALALAAKRIRIQAPVPGKGYIGIEVPNEKPRLVPLRRVIESAAFQRLNSPLALALGEDVAGRAVAADLRGMPHLLIAGATGSGKSVALNSIITTFLLFNTPNDLRLILIDPKRVELTGYNFIPHLLAPVVVDMERVTATLQWVLQEMDRRYERLARAGARHIQEYHRRVGEAHDMPYLVVVIDELADLMMLAPTETERAVTRLAQLARATGIHLIIATQRPSVDVVTGLIKANFPARIAFAVASVVDSRVILDRPGAERLLGRGDMLFQPPDAPEPLRVQGAFVSDAEIRRVVQHWRAQAGQASTAGEPTAAVDVATSPLPWREEDATGLQPEPKVDPLLEEAIRVVRAEGRASISLLQRRLRIGYSRAARLIDTLESRGIVGPPQGGTGVRPVLAPAEGAEADRANASTPGAEADAE